MSELSDRDPIISNRVYDLLKFSVQLLLPAISTLYFTLGTIWSWPSIEQIVGSIAAVTVFLGVFLKASSKVYDSSTVKYDGELVVNEGDDKDLYSLEVFDEIDALRDKKDIMFRVRPSDK